MRKAIGTDRKRRPDRVLHVLQQIDAHNFQAYGAAVTSSRMGVPRYWLQSQQVTFQDNQRTAIHPVTGALAVDPVTGEPAVEHDMLATSRNNFLFFGGYPIFYWPTLATDLREPIAVAKEPRNGNDVDRSSGAAELEHSFVDPAVCVGIKMLRRQRLLYAIEGVFVEQDGAEHRTLCVQVVRRNATRARRQAFALGHQGFTSLTHEAWG